MTDDIATPNAHGLKLCSGNILRPTLEVGTPGLRYATDRQEPRREAEEVDEATDPTTVDPQSKSDRDLQLKKDSHPYPKHADDPKPIKPTAPKK